MKIYTTKSPSLSGIIKDDELYFDGMKRPAEVFDLRDAGDLTVLETYLNDIYNLYLRKLSVFIDIDIPNEEDCLKLQALLQEIIKVKQIMAGKGDNI